MNITKKGDTVQVHYTGKLTTGEIFDSSEGREPLQFEVGAGQMIPGFDKGVEGMAVGDKKTINIIPAEAYGERVDDHVIPFPKQNIPEEMELEVGQSLQLSDPMGNPVPVVVQEIKEDVVLLDANHPLAGKELVFEVEMVSIQPKSLIIT